MRVRTESFLPQHTENSPRLVRKDGLKQCSGRKRVPAVSNRGRGFSVWQAQNRPETQLRLKGCLIIFGYVDDTFFGMMTGQIKKLLWAVRLFKRKHSIKITMASTYSGWTGSGNAAFRRGRNSHRKKNT